MSTVGTGDRAQFSARQVPTGSRYGNYGPPQFRVRDERLDGLRRRYSPNAASMPRGSPAKLLRQGISYFSSGGNGTEWKRRIFHSPLSRRKASVVGADTCCRFPSNV